MKKTIKPWVIVLALIAVAASAFFAAVFPKNSEKHQTRILLYHAVSDSINGSDDALYASPPVFESHMRALKESGFLTVFADEYGEYSVKTVAVTFDDGYENLYTEAFPILKKYGIKATVFLITSDRPNHLTGDQIKEMAESGLVLFASHTVSHRDMTTLTYDEMKEELKASKEAVENLSSQNVRCFAYPFGSLNDEVKRAVAECGYKYGFATDGGSGEDLFSIPRKTVWRETTAETILGWLN